MFDSETGSTRTQRTYHTTPIRPRTKPHQNTFALRTIDNVACCELVQTGSKTQISKSARALLLCASHNPLIRHVWRWPTHPRRRRFCPRLPPRYSISSPHPRPRSPTVPVSGPVSPNPRYGRDRRVHVKILLIVLELVVACLSEYCCPCSPACGQEGGVRGDAVPLVPSYTASTRKSIGLSCDAIIDCLLQLSACAGL